MSREGGASLAECCLAQAGSPASYVRPHTAGIQVHPSPTPTGLEVALPREWLPQSELEDITGRSQ